MMLMMAAMTLVMTRDVIIGVGGNPEGHDGYAGRLLIYFALVYWRHARDVVGPTNFIVFRVLEVLPMKLLREPSNVNWSTKSV